MKYTNYSFIGNSDSAMTTVSIMLAMSTLRSINHARKERKTIRKTEEQIKDLKTMTDDLRKNLVFSQGKLDEMKEELAKEKENLENLRYRQEDIQNREGIGCTEEKTIRLDRYNNDPEGKEKLIQALVNEGYIVIERVEDEEFSEERINGRV